jgi:hypothetical protein
MLTWSGELRFIDHDLQEYWLGDARVGCNFANEDVTIFLQVDLLKSHEVMLGWGVVLQMKMSLFFKS